MRCWRSAAAAALFLADAQAHAQGALKTAHDLALKCIADNQSSCSQFIVASIDALESARKTRGEASCLGGQPPADAVVRKFIRAVIDDYAYSDASAPAAVEAIYKDYCAQRK
jgi:hypothetical protein